MLHVIFEFQVGGVAHVVEFAAEIHYATCLKTKVEDWKPTYIDKSCTRW